MPTPSNNAFPAAGITKLTQLAIIAVSGDDAVGFLNGQLTNDIKSLSENQVCLAGYCTPKGRLLATMLVWSLGETIYLEVPLALQEAVQKRLQMYVMRSKVKLEHISASYSVFGIIGHAAGTLSTSFPTLPAQPYTSITNQSGTILRLADADGAARYQWIAPSELAAQIWPSLAPQIDEQNWSLSEIHAGIPHISVATQEKFVPQMVNYELIGGVSFKKGCYPGQEIVARTHYLGKQKRRMVLAQVANISVKDGMEVFDSADLSQPCGMIVNAAPNMMGGSDCLIEIKTTLLNQTLVQLQSGEPCHWLPMPYDLPALPALTDDANKDNQTD